MRVAAWDTLLLLVIFAFTFGVFLPTKCHDWVYSVYYDESTSDMDLVRRALSLNDQRLSSAEQYFSTANKYLSSQGSANADIVIAIIAMRRRMDKYSPGYLTQTAAAVHEQYIKDQYFPDKHVFICNVDPDPDQVPEVTFLKPYFEVVNRFSESNSSDNVFRDEFVKSKDDYGFCLQTASSNKPKFVLLLEDDVLLAERFFEKLFYVLKSKLALLRERNGAVNDNEWCYMKLYYPENWQGYGNEWRHHVERAGVAICGGTLFTFLRYLLGRCYRRTRRITTLGRRKNWTWFLAGSIYCLAVCQTVGRPYFLHLLSFSPHLYRVHPDRGCCTQAVLYPSQVIPDLVQHLRAVGADIDLSHDLIIDRWATDRHDCPRFLVSPNLVTHIGMISTVRQWAKKAAYFIY